MSSLKLLLRVVAIGLAVVCPFSAHAEIKVLSTVKAKTPEVGYNASAFREGSNGFDWLRYSGIKNIRVFMSPTSLEPVDDRGPYGDNVTTKKQFTDRQEALRKNSSSSTKTALSNDIVDWNFFKDHIDNAGENYLYGEAFPRFNSMGIEIMATLQAYQKRFTLEAKPLDQFTAEDYGNMWELWQHYYAVSYHLGRYYNVRRYSMYNEPNLEDSMTTADLDLRLRVASDAIRAGIADMNKRFKKTLVPQIFSPNTGGPAYYNEPGETGEDWGHTVIANRKVGMWGDTLSTRKNVDVYNFQKYTLLQHTDRYSGFIETCQEVKDGMKADMGTEPILPVALTEMNARTGKSYSTQEENADTPKDFVSVGATAVALTNDCPTGFLYLFKFGMGERDDKSVLAKNGTHYLNIDDPDHVPGALNNYGGAAGTAEVWRLYTKAAGSLRNSYNLTSDQTPDVWMMVTRNSSPAATYIYVANRSLLPKPLLFNFSSLSISSGSVATIEEVSKRARGAVVDIRSVASNKLDAGVMPPESVWLISIYHGRTVSGKKTYTASDNTQLRDGVGENAVITPVPATLIARADGDADNRKLALIKFSKPSNLSNTRILLQLNAAQDLASPSGTPTQAHVYGVTYDGWKASTSTLYSLNTLFKRDVQDGQMIANNVLLKQGGTTLIQGQLVVDSTTPTLKYIDVTDFVKAQTDSTLSFLIAQEHRWDYHPNAVENSLPTGEVQDAGIGVSSRAVTATAPKLIVY